MHPVGYADGSPVLHHDPVYTHTAVNRRTQLVGADDSYLTYPKGLFQEAARLGITGPNWTVGSGKLGIDLSTDYLLTAHSEIAPPMPSWAWRAPPVALWRMLEYTILQEITMHGKLCMGVNCNLDF